MKKFSISSLLSQLLLLFFVIIWIIPTFGLFISSLRDKDLLAISGWWTSLTTTEVNEIYRMSGMESQIEEDGYFKIKGKLFEDNSGKKIESFGITSKKLMNLILVISQFLKMKVKCFLMKMEIMNGDQEQNLKRKKVKDYLLHH